MQIEVTVYGIRMWNSFGGPKPSSTRCEAGAALMGMLQAKPVHIGTDSLSMMMRAEKIKNHIKDRNEVQLYTESGRMILGGKEAPLHSESPWPRPWGLMKDGDLWEKLHSLRLQKGIKR